MPTHHPLPSRVGAPDLRDRAGQDPAIKILDVRSPAEFESAHIPGSYNVPLDELPRHREELRAGLDGPVVLVCRSGARAQQAETLLREADVQRVHVLDGELLAFRLTDLPVLLF